MSGLVPQVIKNTRRISDDFHRRGAAITVINGQEFYSKAKGEHNFWLTLDNDMELIATMKFKFVCGNGRISGGGGIQHGSGTFKGLQDWMEKYPPGTYVDTDNAHGAQCWDYANAFWLSQVGRSLVTRPGGNGNACDCWNISLDANKVGFKVVYNWSDLRPGDWAFWNCGSRYQFGHIALCVGPQNSNGTYPFYGQNQGGVPVQGGGAAVSMANFGPADFLGALRYNGWA